MTDCVIVIVCPNFFFFFENRDQIITTLQHKAKLELKIMVHLDK